MKSITVRTTLGVLLLAAAATTAQAQVIPDTRGLHIGAAANATSIKIDETEFSDDERENGYGAHLYAGYNFTKNLGLLLSLTAATINDNLTEDFGVAHIDLMGRASFPGRSALVPYLELGLSAVGAGYDAEGGEVDLSGGGLGLGAGINFFFSRKAALDLGFRYTAGEFGTAKINDREVDSGDGVGFNTTRINLGIAFYP